MRSSLIRQLWAGLRVLLVLTVITGIVYPLVVWGVSRIPGLHDRAEGSIVTANGQPVGSKLIGVDPVAKDPNHDPYFHNRPSALSSDPLGPGDPSSSLASNLSADSAKLVKLIGERKDAIAKREGVTPQQVPPDAVTASASGLDPDISQDYAALQAPRVARENGLSLTEVRQLIQRNTSGRGLGVLGEPTVNVLELNLAVRSARDR